MRTLLISLGFALLILGSWSVAYRLAVDMSDVVEDTVALGIFWAIALLAKERTSRL